MQVELKSLITFPVHSDISNDCGFSIEKAVSYSKTQQEIKDALIKSITEFYFNFGFSGKKEADEAIKDADLTGGIFAVILLAVTKLNQHICKNAGSKNVPCITKNSVETIIELVAALKWVFNTSKEGEITFDDWVLTNKYCSPQKVSCFFEHYNSLIRILNKVYAFSSIYLEKNELIITEILNDEWWEANGLKRKMIARLQAVRSITPFVNEDFELEGYTLEIKYEINPAFNTFRLPKPEDLDEPDI